MSERLTCLFCFGAAIVFKTELTKEDYENKNFDKGTCIACGGHDFAFREIGDKHA